VKSVLFATYIMYFSISENMSPFLKL